MLFLAGADHERYGKVKWTRRYLPDTAVSSKKGDFNTPPVFQFSKRKTAAEMNYFNRRDISSARSL